MRQFLLLKMELVVISVFYSLFYIVTAQSDSSCTPHIFSYKTDDPNTLYYPYLYGIIRTPVPRNVQGVWILKVEISIGNLIGETKGSINLITPLLEETIQQNEPLLFEVRFPYWINIKPKITKITVNENLICVGEPIEEDLAPNRLNYIISYTLQSSNIVQQKISTQPIPLPVTETPSYNWNFPTTSIQSVRSVYHPPNRSYPSSSSCGVMSAMESTISLIVGGAINPEGATPWLAALFQKKNRKHHFICGSNLITERHLITAAHCVNGFSDIKIFSLALGRSNFDDWTIGESRKLKDIHVHPDYINDKPDADLAILVMSQEVPFSSTIAPICLWNNNINFQQTVGTLGIVAGWGRDESGNMFTPQSKQITLPIVSEEVCLASDTKFRDIISKRTFCAGSRENTGPCTGDSGGGFYVESPEKKWYIRGIVSVALRKDNTCDLGNYLVFVDIALHSKWIMSHLT